MGFFQFEFVPSWVKRSGCTKRCECCKQHNTGLPHCCEHAQKLQSVSRFNRTNRNNKCTTDRLGD